MESLGDRQKSYEAKTRVQLESKVPVVIRVDGKKFSSFTKGFKKPFDSIITNAMFFATKRLAENMQGFKFAYTQSDEDTFVLTDYEREGAQGWMNYQHSKLVSISASMFTVYFNDSLRAMGYAEKHAFFDTRAFNVPKEDVANNILWRMNDWRRNSISQYARAFYSAKELHGKKTDEMLDMLIAKGSPWDHLEDRLRYGTFWIREDHAEGRGYVMKTNIEPRYENVACEVNSLIGVEKKDKTA